jgi:hypothetical protein
MSMFGWSNGSNNIPFYFGAINNEGRERIEHDSYEVYVNGDYVGEKTLISQGEKISDIDKHLKVADFKNFNEETIGNHVNIKTDDLEEARKIKQNLNIYLSIR